jgi:ElaB/YqjD/DUF883 family membrane-anchored ribosome-binding protein
MKNDALSAPMPRDAADAPSEIKKLGEDARSDLQSHVQNVKSEVRQAVDEVSATAAATVALARDELKSLGSDARTHLALSSEEVGHYIGRNPLKSVGAAVPWGFLFGFLIRR